MGFFGLLECMVHIALMFKQCRVTVFGVAIRLLQRFQCFLIPAKLKQHPAKAVQVRRIIGLRCDGDPYHLLCFFKLFTLIGVQISKIVVNTGIRRIFRIDIFQDFLSLAHISTLHVCVGKPHTNQSQGLCVRCRIFRRQQILLDRVFPLVLASVNACKADTGFDDQLRIFCKSLQGFFQQLFGHFQFSVDCFHHCQTGQELRLIRNHLQRFLESLSCSTDIFDRRIST